MKSLPILLSAAVASVQVASAAILVVGVADNSTLRSGAGQADINQSTSQILFVGDTTTSGDYLRSALAFDLSAPALSGATINSATLTFYVRSSDSSSQNTSITLNLHELSSSFTNAGVTWNSRDGTNSWLTPGGDFGGILATASGNPRAAAGTAVSFTSATFASAVEDAIGSTFYLLAKSSVEENTNRNLFQFTSTRDSNTSRHPVLTIDYTPVPEPSTAIFGGLGFLALLRRRR